MMRRSFVSFAVLLLSASLGGTGCRSKNKKAASSVEIDGLTPAAAVASVPGFKIEEIEEGKGDTAVPGKLVSVHYTGWLGNGAKFDTSLERQPLEFELGKKQVLKGWDLGIPGMKVGGKRKITVPPSLGYGEKGSVGGAIPPNSTMVFDVQLVA